ncbi:MAG: hypothetical protein GWP05_05695 [Anaerolineaceae bacterium]|nr:hypothetical protein [Anaerolineaceae bacterium]
MRSVTVIHSGGIGDFLQVLPTLEAIRGKWPEAEATIVGHRQRGELARLGGLAEGVVELETCGCHHLFVGGASCDSVCDSLRDAELILNFLPQETFSENLERLTSARVLSLRSFPAPGDGAIPAAQFVYDQVASELDLPPARAVPRLTLPNGPRETEAAAMIHPGSGSQSKNWPLNRFRRLADRLIGRGLQVTWIVGPAETESSEFADLAPEENRAVCPALTDLATMLSAARLYVGNDSGITHLAAAVGAPTVALFGPSNAAVWAPRGANVRTIVSPTGRVADIPLADVAAAAEKALVSPATPSDDR